MNKPTIVTSNELLEILNQSEARTFLACPKRRTPDRWRTLIRSRQRTLSSNSDMGLTTISASPWLPNVPISPPLRKTARAHWNTAWSVCSMASNHSWLGGIGHLYVVALGDRVQLWNRFVISAMVATVQALVFSARNNLPRWAGLAFFLGNAG